MKNLEDRLSQGPSSRAEFIASLEHCPSCLELLIDVTGECPSCGVMLSHFKRVSSEKRLKLTVGGLHHLSSYELEGLETLWGQIEVFYFDQDLHHRFLGECVRLRALAYAYRKYQERAELMPDDETAIHTQEQIIALAGELVPQGIESPEAEFPETSASLRRILGWMLVLGLIAGAATMLLSGLTREKFWFFSLGLATFAVSAIALFWTRPRFSLWFKNYY